MKEIDQSHLTFRNAELFWGKIYSYEWSLNQVIFVGSEKIREAIREEKMEKMKVQKEVNVELFIVE